MSPAIASCAHITPLIAMVPKTENRCGVSSNAHEALPQIMNRMPTPRAYDHVTQYNQPWLYEHADAHTHACTNAHAHAQAHALARVLAQAHAYAYTLKHAHTHACTCTQAPTPALILMLHDPQAATT